MVKSKEGKTKLLAVAEAFAIDKKDMITKLKDMGIGAKNHASSLTMAEVNYVFAFLLKQTDDGSDLTPWLDQRRVLAEAAFEAAQKRREAELKQAEPAVQEEVKPIIVAPKSRTVDTRRVVVDTEKLANTEKAEKLATVEMRDTETQKQRIKKGPDQRAAIQRQNQQFRKGSKQQQPVQQPAAKKLTWKDRPRIKIIIPEEISVSELASKLAVTAAEVVKALFKLGVMAAIGQSVDFDTAAIVADGFNADAEKEVIVTDEEILFKEDEDSPEQLVERAPVVVIMGHVDHGKTSLLDSIRKTNVVAGEAGGITQHIGAYRVRVGERKITFIDTPGHEAFTAMRLRGAQVTDVAIIVVAADDGVKPQTIEAINHAKIAGVSIIVAVNKIDKEGADPNRVRQEMMEQGLVPEEWGGDTVFVDISAKQKTNLDSLLDMILLVADMKELKANPNRKAKGAVIESKLDKGRGPVATVLVQNGTLNVGDFIIAGHATGRVRAMNDENGKKRKSAGPSVPVEIVGLAEVPEGGDDFLVVTDERMAKAVAEKRRAEIRAAQNKTASLVSLQDLFSQIKEGEIKELNIIIKADANGSVEALKQSLEKITNEEVRVKVIAGAVGAVNESDIALAAASNAIIVGFNVRPDAGALAAAKVNSVDLRTYSVIYECIDEITAATKGLLDPKFQEVIIGHAEIRQTFKVSGVGTIGGSYVKEGKVARASQARLVRNGIVVHTGELSSLKRFKDDAKEVAAGYECGIMLEKFNDLKEGDILECFVMEQIKE